MFYKYLKVTAKPIRSWKTLKGVGESYGKSWNLKSSKECHLPCIGYWPLSFAIVSVDMMHCQQQ